MSASDSFEIAFATADATLLAPHALDSSRLASVFGEILTRSRRHQEDFIAADIDPAPEPSRAWGLTRSAWSHREFGSLLAEAAKGA